MVFVRPLYIPEKDMGAGRAASDAAGPQPHCPWGCYVSGAVWRRTPASTRRDSGSAKDKAEAITTDTEEARCTAL